MTDTHPRAPRLSLGLARLGIRGRLTALVVVAPLGTLAVGATGLLAVRAALDQVRRALSGASPRHAPKPQCSPSPGAVCRGREPGVGDAGARD